MKESIYTFLIALLLCLTSGIVSTVYGQTTDSLVRHDSLSLSNVNVTKVDSNTAIHASADSTKLADSTATAQVEQMSDPSANDIFEVNPQIGFTFSSSSKSDEESENLQWSAGLDMRVYRDGANFQWAASFMGKYGQQHTPHELPKKMEDDLIASITPSRTLMHSIGLRLFLEAGAETQFTKGTIDGNQTNFADPLFLYQTLFLGKRVSSSTDDHEFTLVYGLGYALQQTITHNFVLEENRSLVIDQNNPLQSVQSEATLESGYSAIWDMTYRLHLSSEMTFSLNAKAVGLTKKGVTESIKNSRISSTYSTGIEYKMLSLEYSGHLVYDRNLSTRRQLEQSLLFGFKLHF